MAMQKIFETGSYGMHVDLALLDALVASFTGPVPIRVEFGLLPEDECGRLDAIERRGEELWGDVDLDARGAEYSIVRPQIELAHRDAETGALIGPKVVAAGATHEAAATTRIPTPEEVAENARLAAETQG